MQVQLTSLSPLSFTLVKEGDLVRIRYKAPKLNEYREKIGPPVECYLIFKGETKLGMIPGAVARDFKKFLVKKSCRVVRVDAEKSIFLVELEEG